MRLAVVSGIVTWDAPSLTPSSHWPIFSLSPVKVPEVFARVHSAQFPSVF